MPIALAIFHSPSYTAHFCTDLGSALSSFMSFLVASVIHSTSTFDQRALRKEAKMSLMSCTWSQTILSSPSSTRHAFRSRHGITASSKSCCCAFTSAARVSYVPNSSANELIDLYAASTPT